MRLPLRGFHRCYINVQHQRKEKVSLKDVFVSLLWLSPAGRSLVPTKQKRASNGHGPQSVYSRVQRHEGLVCVNQKKAFLFMGAAGAPHPPRSDVRWGGEVHIRAPLRRGSDT